MTPIPVAESYPSFELAVKVLTVYTWPPLFVIGILGDIASFFISFQEQNRRISTCVYVGALAAADTLVVVNGMCLFTVIFHFYDKIQHKEFALQWFAYWANTYVMISGFFLVWMSIDRLVAVRFPMLAPSICSTFRAKVTCVVTAALTMVCNLHLFFIYKISPGDDTQLIPSVQGLPSLEVVSTIYFLMFGTILPFTIIVGCNVIIIVTLREASVRRKTMTTGGGAGKTDQADTTHLTKMLILVFIVFVICSIPNRLHYALVNGVPSLVEVYTSGAVYWGLRAKLEYWSIQITWYLNHCVNFFLYCIGGGKRYRKDVRLLFRQILCKKTET
ncbi:G-protein coupled estrogen receptor 1-like isoform X1 [Lineus longissimus]|uniref:G-protein coupled estrogen receptor 1-like isoform X1 n=1 Tax=Lineus longissimus TaxID=88925 RepID=UPI002B4F3597